MGHGLWTKISPVFHHPGEFVDNLRKVIRFSASAISYDVKNRSDPICLLLIKEEILQTSPLLHTTKNRFLTF